ncbi:MAG: hypothetical protein ACYC0V_06630 [Armatimonadota bacterium]
MDDKHLEDMLRECWTPAESDGMQERVLARSIEALGHGKRRPALMLGWRPALALMGILTVLVTGAFDKANQSRITAMVEGPNAGMMPSTTCKVDFLSSRYRLDRLLAQSSAEYGLTDNMEGSGTL